MKGFKSTGKGPRYGNFNFSSRSGFADSSGKTRTVSSYTRKVAKHARGGLANAVGSSMTPPEAASMTKRSPIARARPAEILSGPTKTLGTRVSTRNPLIRK